MSRRNRLRPRVLSLIACIGLLYSSSLARAQDRPHIRTNSSVALEKEVYHQLVLLPFLTVFDNLEFQVTGTQVTLLGQVTQPTLKGDAEKAVKGIEGVTEVINNIEVLPVSPMDSQIRRAEFHAIYGDPALEKYAVGNMPGIHIVVNGGHVRLAGTVDNGMDKEIAEIRAKGVHNVFVVNNELKIRPRS
jgi:hyperosmotically inducible protein